MFLKEKIAALYDAARNADEDIAEMVLDALHSFDEYVKYVAMEEQRMQAARFRMEPEDFRELVMAIDRARRIRHNTAVMQLGVLNRLAGQFGMEPFLVTDDREAVAKFAMDVVNDYFTTTAAM